MSEREQEPRTPHRPGVHMMCHVQGAIFREP